MGNIPGNNSVIRFNKLWGGAVESLWFVGCILLSSRNENLFRAKLDPKASKVHSQGRY
jgi:hypothetical protein